MRRVLLFTAVGICLASGWSGVSAGHPGDDTRNVSGQPVGAKPAAQEGSCGSFGTSVEFVRSPSDAARQAKKEEKLVFVLHVSGHFEDPRFT